MRCVAHDRRAAGAGKAGAQGCRKGTGVAEQFTGLVEFRGIRPGIILGRASRARDRLPLTLTGRAWCKVDATYGPIALGDLLTTSSTPGHAMTASDPSTAFGAVIGKALRPWNDGAGLVPVLVALQ